MSLRLRLHEISAVRFHWDQIHCDRVRLNGVAFTRAGYHLEWYSSMLDGLYYWTHLVSDIRTDLEFICQVPYKQQAYPYQFRTGSELIWSRVNVA